jgi:hypothetical protein
MTARKTIKVTDLLDKVNDILATTTCNQDIRQGAINLLEHVLHETGNYRGFRYLDADEVPNGEKPGIILDPDSICPHADYQERFKNTDYTRIKYFS